MAAVELYPVELHCVGAQAQLVCDRLNEQPHLELTVRRPRAKLISEEILEAARFSAPPHRLSNSI